MKKINSKFMKDIVPYIGLIALIVLFSLTTNGRFTAARNLTNIIGQSMVTMIAACGSVLSWPIIIWIFHWAAAAPWSQH